MVQCMLYQMQGYNIIGAMTQSNLSRPTLKDIINKDSKIKHRGYNIIGAVNQKNLIRDIVKNILNRETRNQKERHSTAYQAPKIQHKWCHDT